MTPKQQAALLQQAKDWFSKVIMENHKANTKKLADLSEFQVNPFLLPYLAAFLTGDMSPQSKAKALLLPRVLGTSINTSFGTNIQAFTTDVLKNVFGSTTDGIDIEFIDALTGAKTYCQVKLGPNTINKDDVVTINDHFAKAKRLAKTNRAKIANANFMVGVLYGSATDLSGHYKALRDNYHYDVFVGQEFWHHLTGSTSFYQDLQIAFAQVAVSAQGKELLESVAEKLAEQIQAQEI